MRCSHLLLLAVLALAVTLMAGCSDTADRAVASRLDGLSGNSSDTSGAFLVDTTCEADNPDFLVSDTIVSDSSSIRWGIGCPYSTFLNKEYFYVGFSTKWKIPLWVGYHIDSAKLAVRSSYSPSFKQDPAVPDSLQADNDDYVGTNPHRGHNVPRRVLEYHDTALYRGNLYTNICPQDSNFNMGRWAQLEEEVRECVGYGFEVWVVTGSIFTSCPPVQIGPHQVAWPSHCFKAVLCRCGDDNYQSCGFLMPNQSDLPGRSVNYMYSVDQLEAITGYDFFPLLEDAIGSEFESSVPEWPMGGTWVP